MKKILLCLFALTMSAVIEAQTISNEQLDKITKADGTVSWSKKAKKLAKDVQLSDGTLQLVDVVYHQLDKKEAYNRIRKLAIQEFGATSLIDETDGFSFKCTISNLCSRSIVESVYTFNIQPILRFDFKEGRMRFVFTLRYYDVEETTSPYVANFGSFVVVGGAIPSSATSWAIKDCAPFVHYGSHPTGAASKAFVYTLACRQIILDRVKQIIYQKAEGNLSDDW